MTSVVHELQDKLSAIFRLFTVKWPL